VALAMSRARLGYSVLVPVFNEAQGLVELVERTAAVFAAMGAADDFEFLFVDDGSTDDSAAIIQRCAAERPYVKAVRLRRNWGKSLALSAGLQYATGRIIITMDSDLQDHPEDIPKLLAGIAGGVDMVNGWRTARADTRRRRIGSRIFNWTVRRFTGLALHDMNCGFKAYRAEVASALWLYGQYHRYVPVQAHLAGFKVTELPVANSPRRFGASKFRTIRYEGVLDLMSLLFLHRYGFNPMYFFGAVSVVIIVPSLAVLSYFIYSQILFWMGEGAPVVNRPLLSFTLTALLLGILVFLIGFVCDFVLHHQIRDRMRRVVLGSVAELIGTEESAEPAVDEAKFHQP
jgi:glycosyltransferase involved in cell wall biosynthesis